MIIPTVFASTIAVEAHSFLPPLHQLELFGLYLPNLFVAVEVGETAGNMMKALVGSAVVLLGQVPAFPPLSRFIREQKDRRRVSSTASSPPPLEQS